VLVTFLNILVSSANLSITLMLPSSKTLMKNRNSNGPTTDPCGIPLSTSVHVELYPSKQTLCFLSSSHDATHLTTWPSIPWACSLANKCLWGTLSKAFAKSRNTTSTIPYWLMTSVITSRNSKILVIHDLPLRKPCCVSDQFVSVQMSYDDITDYIDSITFDSGLVRLTAL